jgi:hypothetical protein
MRQTLPTAGAGLGTHLQFHQPLGCEADHLAQQIGIGCLGKQRLKGHPVVGHRRVSVSVVSFGDKTLPKIRDDRRCG